jgi:hypothetical protein
VRVRVPRRIFPITVICAEEQRGQVIDGLHLNEDAPTAMVQINLTSSVAETRANPDPEFFLPSLG